MKKKTATKSSPTPSVRKWKNRIVGNGEKPASWFIANEENWRIHPKPQQGAIEAVLDDIGWIQSVIVNKRTSPKWPADKRNVETMIDGHMRVGRAMAASPDEPVPFIYVDLEPEEELKALATYDPIGKIAQDDEAKFRSIMERVKFDNEAINALVESVAKGKRGAPIIGAEVPFSQEIGEENQYIVLLFTRDIDWQAAVQHFGIEQTASKGSKGERLKAGIGRVVDGAKYLASLFSK